MVHYEDSVYSFFDEDIRRLAPREAALPPLEAVEQSQLWDDLVIDIYQDKAAYSSLSHRNLTYRIPFQSPGESRYEHLMRVACRFETLAQWGCIKRVVWKLHSSPDDRSNDVALHCFRSLRGASIMEVHVGAQAGEWTIEFARNVRSMSRLDSLLFIFRQGNFAEGGMAYKTIRQIRRACKLDGNPLLRFHIEVSSISRNGHNLLQRAISPIELVTIHELTSKKFLETILSFLDHYNRNRVELNITRLEIAGEVDIFLPAENVSLSIGAVRKGTKVIVSCSGELSCLTVGKGVSKHIYSRNMDIYEVRIADGPDDATIQLLRSRFARIARVVKLEMAPRLGTLEENNLW